MQNQEEEKQTGKQILSFLEINLSIDPLRWVSP